MTRIRTDLSGLLVTMHSVLWEQYLKSLDHLTSCFICTVFEISAGPRTLTGKIWVGPASFPFLPYINFGKIVLRSGKFQILFWRLCPPLCIVTTSPSRTSLDPFSITVIANSNMKYHSNSLFLSLQGSMSQLVHMEIKSVRIMQLNKTAIMKKSDFHRRWKFLKNKRSCCF